MAPAQGWHANSWSVPYFFHYYVYKCMQLYVLTIYIDKYWTYKYRISMRDILTFINAIHQFYMNDIQHILFGYVFQCVDEVYFCVFLCTWIILLCVLYVYTNYAFLCFSVDMKDALVCFNVYMKYTLIRFNMFP